MQLHALTTGEYADRTTLGTYTTRKALEAGLVEHALAGRVRGPVHVDHVDVEGDPVVIVLTDDDGEALVAGPFDSWLEANGYSPEEEFTVAEWTVERYAQAVAAARAVTTEDLVAILRTHADTEPVPWADGNVRTRELAAQLADAFTGWAPFAWSAVKVGDVDPTAGVNPHERVCSHRWDGIVRTWGCTRVLHADPHHVAGDGRNVVAVEHAA